MIHKPAAASLTRGRLTVVSESSDESGTNRLGLVTALSCRAGFMFSVLAIAFLIFCDRDNFFVNCCWPSSYYSNFLSLAKSLQQTVFSCLIVLRSSFPFKEGFEVNTW